MKLFDLFEGNEQAYNWHSEPEQRNIDDTRRARLYREREPEGSEAIDARLRAQNDHLAQYARSGQFWLKQKDTQEHISDAFVGKAAANAAAVELLKQRPELKGNLVITAYGPGEQQGVSEESALDRVRDKLSSQGYAPTQQHRLQDRERHNEKLDAIHQSFLNRQQNSDQADDARAQFDRDLKAWQLQQMQRNADDNERTMDMFRDRLNRYQYGTQRDVDPEQLAAISNIQYQPRRKKSDFVPKNEGAELDKFKTKSGKFPEPRERKPGQVLSKSETLGRDGKIYHWQDPRAKQGVAEGSLNENADVLAGLTDILKIAATRQAPQNPRYFAQQVKDVALQLKDNPATQQWGSYLDGVVRWADVIANGKEQYSSGFANEVHNVLGPATRAYQDALLNKQGVAEDLSRRGFLRGLGAAALAGAGGSAAAGGYTPGKPNDWKYNMGVKRPGSDEPPAADSAAAPMQSPAPASGSLNAQSSASRMAAERAQAAAAKIKYTNPKFKEEYDRIENTYNQIKSIVYNNKRQYSADPDLAKRQHAESVKTLIAADTEFAEKTNALINQYGRLKEQGMAEAPGAETLSHNQSTVASNLSSLDLGEGDISQLEKDIAAAPVAPIANMEGHEKIGGRYDADDFDAMVMRLKKLAGSGPMRTVYDPAKRVYRNVPTAQQPPQQPKK